MVQGQHVRKRYKETFSTGQKVQEEAFSMAKNCKRARSASEEIAQRNVYRGRKCHNE